MGVDLEIKLHQLLSWICIYKEAINDIPFCGLTLFLVEKMCFIWKVKICFLFSEECHFIFNKLFITLLVIILCVWYIFMLDFQCLGVSGLGFCCGIFLPGSLLNHVELALFQSASLLFLFKKKNHFNSWEDAVRCKSSTSDIIAFRL